MNKDKKLAICLFGLSKEKYRHWGYDDRWKTKSQYPIFDINWKYSLDNCTYIQALIAEFQEFLRKCWQGCRCFLDNHIIGTHDLRL